MNSKMQWPGELLTTDEMGKADSLAMARGPFDGYGLMLNAGRAVAREVLARAGGAPVVHVLCGPGNNGGDAYVAAAVLRQSGVETKLYALANPRKGSDAAQAAMAEQFDIWPLERFLPDAADLVVDGLFGAGLQRPLEGEAAAAVARCAQTGCRVIAIDLPSGISGDSGKILGIAFEAEATVTFFRKKPGHLLYPGRSRCGDLSVVDIGIPESVLTELHVDCFENAPPLWRAHLPIAAVETHKYARGAVDVFSGGPQSTGAARMAAMAAQRAGAGAVTVHSPASAMQVNASHLTSIMLARCDTAADIVTLLEDGRKRAFVLGPGFGIGEKVRDFADILLQQESEDGSNRGLVLDADGITSFAERPRQLAEHVAASAVPLVLTPHEGEFRRLFPRLAEDESLSKVDRARQAAGFMGATVIYKGPDTVIASPDGRAAINSNGSPALATAGSGDVLAGIVAALLTQDMPAFEACCASVWLHAEVGRIAGTHAIAEDLASLLPAAFRELSG